MSYPYGNNEGKFSLWTLQKLREIFPVIRWTAPLRATNFASGERGLACRICIARHGLQFSNIKYLPQTPEDFREHMKGHLKE